MPRVTYATRLADLAAKPLSDYDRGFVESLTQYYQRKRSMTAGRRAAIERLEERYSDESLAAAAANSHHRRGRPGPESPGRRAGRHDRHRPVRGHLHDHRWWCMGQRQEVH